MEKFHAENSQDQKAHGLPMDTSSVQHNQETLDHQSETEEVSDTADAEDTLQDDGDSYQNPVQLVEESQDMRTQSQPLIDRMVQQQEEQSVSTPVSTPSRSTTPVSLKEEDTRMTADDTEL